MRHAPIPRAPHRLTGQAPRRRPGAVLPRGPDLVRHPAGGRRHAGALLDPAPERDAARWSRTRWTCASHEVLVECRRMGGGFGGKESQSALFACVAAVAAQQAEAAGEAARRPRRRHVITGKRHGFYYEYEVGYDDDGRITRRRGRDGGATPASRPTCRRRWRRARSATSTTPTSCRTSRSPAIRRKTNTQSNTAFRGFGGPQGAIAIEYIIDDDRAHLGQDALDVRRANFYGNDENATSRPTARGRRTTSSMSWSTSWSEQRLPRPARARSPPSTPPARCSRRAWR